MEKGKERSVILAYLAVLLAVFGLSGSGPFGKLAGEEGLDPAVLAFYRLMISQLLILPMVLLKKERRSEVADLCRFNRPMIWLAVLSAFFLAVHYITWYSSVKMTTVYRATVISDLSPIFAMLFTWIFLKNRPKWRQVVSMSVAILGVVLISAKGGDQGGSLIGDIMAILAGFGWAVYFVFGQKIRSGLSVWVYTLVVNLFCILFLLIYILATGRAFIMTPTIAAVAFFVAIFGTMIGHTLLNWALPVTGATFVSLACLGETYVGAFIAWILFGEVPTVVTLIGGAVCLVGVAGYSLWTGRKKKPVEG